MHAIFGLSVDERDTFGLVGCMVEPGFGFADFELFPQAELILQFPQHDAIIYNMAFKTSN